MATELVEVIADELDAAANTTRSLAKLPIGVLFAGIGIGVGAGFFIGYKYSKKKLRSELFAEAEQMVDEMREHYNKKTIALENRDKVTVEELAQEKGYVSTPEATSENATPSGAVDISSDAGHIDYGAQHRKEVTTSADPEVSNVFVSAPKNPDEDWNWEEENLHRTEEDPYILHLIEYINNESGYTQEEYIYYAGDDILVDATDQQMVLHNREHLIGDKALVTFGHGSDNYNSVHVRNPYLELEFMIKRLPGSWETEIVGPDSDDNGE